MVGTLARRNTNGFLLLRAGLSGQGGSAGGDLMETCGLGQLGACGVVGLLKG